MITTFDGYKKRDGNNSNVLLDGGETKPKWLLDNRIIVSDTTETGDKLSSSTGSFTFLGNNLINNLYDWVGLLVSSIVDRGLLVWDNGTLRVRLNDGSDWTDWATLLSDKNWSSYITHLSVTNSNPSLKWNTTHTIGSVGGTNLQFTFEDNEGSSDFTDGTELLSSYASNDGFAVSGTGNKVIYRRKASSMYNYLKGKFDLIYLTSHQSLSNYYTKTEINNKLSSILDVLIVLSLPTISNAVEKTLYLTANSETETNELYKEYIKINKGTSESPNWVFEKLGGVILNVSNFVTAVGISNLQLTWTKGSTVQTPINIDAKTLLGKGLNSTYGGILYVKDDGVMEAGRYLDFHTSNNDNRDYAVRLQVSNTTGTYTQTLPSNSGTIALTSDLSSYALSSSLSNYVLKTGDTMSGNLIMFSNSDSYENAIKAKTKRNVSSGTGWAFAPLLIIGNDDATIAQFGVLGNKLNFTYLYIGNGTYDSLNNFRIYSDHIQSSYLDIDRSNYGSLPQGAQLSVIRTRMCNSGTGTYGFQNIISVFGSGETGSTVNNLPVRIGSPSGATVVSAGEGGTNFISAEPTIGSTENLYLTSDGLINLYTNCNTIANRKHVQIDVYGNIKSNNKGVGLHILDSVGNTYAAILDNTSNLWIGASQTNAIHHKGSTIISAGWYTDNSNNIVGNESIYVCVPKLAAGSTNKYADTGDSYPVIHTGNYQYYNFNLTGYVSTNTSGLSSYWFKAWEATITNHKLDNLDMTWLFTSAFNDLRAIVHFSIRQNGNNNQTGSSINYNFSKYARILSGNIPIEDIRLYCNNSTGKCEIWVNVGGQWGVMNYTILKKSWRVSKDFGTLGTLTSNTFSSALTLPTSSYTTLSYDPAIRKHSGGVDTWYITEGYTYKLAFGISSGNTNRGIYQFKASTNGSGTYSSGKWLLYFNAGDDATFTSDVIATSFYSSSDIRLKNIISNPTYKVEDFANLDLVKYTWKNNEDKVHLGSIAQSAEKKFPELVNTNQDGYKSLDYSVLGTVGVISLAKEIIELKKEIKELKSKLYG